MTLSMFELQQHRNRFGLMSLTGSKRTWSKCLKASTFHVFNQGGETAEADVWRSNSRLMDMGLNQTGNESSITVWQGFVLGKHDKEFVLLAIYLYWWNQCRKRGMKITKRNYFPGLNKCNILCQCSALQLDCDVPKNKKRKKKSVTKKSKKKKKKSMLYSLWIIHLCSLHISLFSHVCMNYTFHFFFKQNM